MKATEDSVTQWFPSTVKPVHVGVYQIYARSIGHELLYRYWDGNNWYLGHTSPSNAAKKSKSEVRLVVFADGLLPWRGLKYKPKNYVPTKR